MNENQNYKNNRLSKKSFTIEERKGYCKAWKKSGMKQIAFCKANGISKSALYQWSKEFEKEDNGFGFSPLALEKSLPIKKEDTVQLNICFSNQMQLSLAMPEHRLVSFIRELDDATAVIR